MSIKEKIFAGLAAIGSAVAAILGLILTGQKNRKLKDELEQVKLQKEANDKVTERLKKERQEHEEKKSNMLDHSAAGFASSVELLQDIARKGRERNK